MDHKSTKSLIKKTKLLDFTPVGQKANSKQLQNVCGYILLAPIIILLIILVVTIFASFSKNEYAPAILKNNSLRISKQHQRLHKATVPTASCKIRLVESIPDGMKFSDSDPKFMSTYDAWSTLLDIANSSLDIGSFYWTLRGEDVVNHTTAAPGEAILKRLLSNGETKKLDIRIAQSQPTDKEPNADTILLSQKGAAKVRSVNFPRLVGGGVLHTKLWIADKQHFYLGSANMDWRSLTQVKELGVLAQDCGSLASDVLKIFEAYWYLGTNTSTIPKQWPKQYETHYNVSNPMLVNFNEKFTMPTYFSNSPPPLTVTTGRTHDVDAIVNTILDAKQYVHIAVMDYFPLMIYGKIQYWPIIDDTLRKAAVERKVSVKLLISWWKHSNPMEDYFLRSLLSISHALPDVDIEIKRFVVPTNEDQEKIPYGRVNHNKYMVTDKVAYIGTSNWSGDYFVNTAGIGLIITDYRNKTQEINEQTQMGPPTIRDDLSSVFMRDWHSPYAIDFK